MSDATDLADRVKRLETQVAELQKAIEVLIQNPNWRELKSPDPEAELGTERRIAAFGSTAARLLKAYAMQMEMFRRLRTGGQQFVRVEHVHVNDGGQAVIGNVKKAEPKA